MAVSRHPFQQAWFVNDLDATIDTWHRLYGAGPFVVAPHHRCDTFDYRGTTTQSDVSYAFGYLGDGMIQFIVQHDESPSIYRDMFAPGEEGYHHIGFLVSDFEAEFRRYVDAGFTPACRLHADGVDAAYFDTRAINGAFTEIHGDPPHIMAAFESWKRAHDEREPGASPYLRRGRV
jgi:catechol 2,3-dioxygenase-like lactoylglutathione lyase family enzyme